MARIGGAGRLFRGLAAGAAASIVVGSVIFVKNLSGVLPEADVIATLAELIGTGYRIDGWVSLAVFGSLLGAAFAYIKQSLVGSIVHRAVSFSLCAWVAVQLILFAAASSGAVDHAPGILLAMVLLAVHLVFGVVLGLVYSSLQRMNPAPRRRRYVTLDTTQWGSRTHS